MKRQRWLQAKEIVVDAQELPSAQREPFLDEVCKGDSDLRREVDSLLAYEEACISILNGPILHGSGLVPGQRVGPYEIEEALGKGGMGQVFLAKRDDFGKQVAIKLIRKGSLSTDLLNRFHMERAILARLEHPNIAAIYDGGVTHSGEPYFAMEYVAGEPIDDYCRTHELPIRDRLELFLKVCSAVQRAHQSLVIHRDLKPGNILVTDEGEPKLIDFGIAKPLGSELAAEGVATVAGRTLGTPRYASPEQVCGDPVTVGTDIYSLGVVLYELLTGVSPYPLEVLRSGRIGRAILSFDPQKPSAAARYRQPDRQGGIITDSEAANPERSRLNSGQSEVRRLQRRLAGDLDSIVLKALRKEPDERYASAERFADDVHRHLQGLPVDARSGTFVYRVWKFARRNRLRLALTVVLFLVALIAGWQILESNRDAELAEVRAQEGARQILQMRSELLNNLFQKSDLSADREGPIQRLLAIGEERIRERLKGESLATQLESLGLLYHRLGLDQRARGLLQECLTLRQSLYPGDHELTARALTNLAAWHYSTGGYDKAEELYREVLAMRERLGQEEVELVKAISNLGTILMHRGEYQSAENYYRRALKIRLAAYGPDDLDVATSRRSLGNLLYVRGDFDTAEDELREAERVRRLHFADDDHRVAAVQSTLGRVLHTRGDLPEAGRILNAVLDSRREHFGDDAFEVAVTHRDLAALSLDLGNLEKAGAYLAKALPILREEKPGDWQTACAESIWGAYLVKQERYSEAEPYLKQSYLSLKKNRGKNSIYTHDARRRFADLYTALGEPLPVWLRAVKE